MWRRTVQYSTVQYSNVMYRRTAGRVLSPGARGAGLDWLDILELQHGVFSEMRGREQDPGTTLPGPWPSSVPGGESGGGEL